MEHRTSTARLIGWASLLVALICLTPTMQRVMGGDSREVVMWLCWMVSLLSCGVSYCLGWVDGRLERCRSIAMTTGPVAQATNSTTESEWSAVLVSIGAELLPPQKPTSDGQGRS